MERISLEFHNLKQTTKTISEMNRKFTEMARFCPLYAANEEMRIARYLSMLREDIREFVSSARHTTLADLMESARRRELFLATSSKRKEAPIAAVHVSSSPKKQQKRYDTRSSSKGGESSGTNNEASKSGVRCFKCGKTGHRAWQCPEKAGVCFQCGKVGHVRKDCPDVKHGSAPAQLRITDGRPVTARVHQLTAEEAQNSSKVVTCTIPFFLFSTISAL